MDREIEFRGKGVYAVYVNIKTGKEQLQWCYGTLRYIYDSATKRTHRKDKAIIDSVFGDNEVIYSTLGQFTGLTDKNGKKIYEGDIVRFYRIEEIGYHSLDEESEWKIEEYVDSVVFDCGRFVLNNEHNLDLAYLTADYRCSPDFSLSEEYGYIVNQDDYPFIKTMNDTLYAEVIGNIYDDPELLSDEPDSVCPGYSEFLKDKDKKERLKEKYGFSSYEDTYEEYSRICGRYRLDVPSFEEWILKEETRRRVLCETDENYKKFKFVSYKDYKTD